MYFNKVVIWATLTPTYLDTSTWSNQSLDKEFEFYWPEKQKGCGSHAIHFPTEYAFQFIHEHKPPTSCGY